MSQRRRPSTPQTLSEGPRMPFEAAEALLWGRETYREHQFLYPRMKELEEQHQAYDARIQATEAIAETAEAATSRIRRIEQQIAAIESDEQDRPFDKWVEGEITAFKGFMEQNKTVRQKYIELEAKISDIGDGVDKAKDATRDVEILLNRIGRLENERISDVNRIKRLEREVLNLASIRSKQAEGTSHLVDLRPSLASSKHPGRPSPAQANRPERAEESNGLATAMTQMASSKYVGRPLPTRGELEASDAADETEDEEVLPVHREKQLEAEEIQVPQSPTILFKSTSTVLPSSPTKGRGNMSARLRIMQRKSFFEPKRPREDEPELPLNPAPASKLRGTRPSHPPPTQIISRAGPTRPLPALVLRTPEQMPPKRLIVKLSVQKRKVEEAGPITRLTRSQAKKNNASQLKDLVSNEVPSTVETQLDEPAPKRRKPNTTRAAPQARSKAKEGSTATVPPPTQLLASLRKKQTTKSSVASGSAKSRGNPGISTKNAGPSKSKTIRQEKPAKTSVTAAERHSKPVVSKEGAATISSTSKPATSRPGPKAQRGLQRAPLTMPVTFDSVTYEEMKKNGEFLF